MTGNPTGTGQTEGIMTEIIELQSELLQRTMRIDFYHPGNINESAHPELLLINDGQDLVKMNFEEMLRHLYEDLPLKPMIVVGIHCGTDRKNEYGMSVSADSKGWGAKAAHYEQFIITELLPFIRSRFQYFEFSKIGFAGFSLGGLSALDIAWNNPELFSTAAVFSGSLWWRSVDKDDKHFDQWKHRMMHKQIAAGEFRPGMKFFFECGELDELADRNKNGVIDSIDDTIDIMRLLSNKGYVENKDFFYLQLADGRHDVPSWARALPWMFAKMI